MKIVNDMLALFKREPNANEEFQASLREQERERAREEARQQKDIDEANDHFKFRQELEEAEQELEGAEQELEGAEQKLQETEKKQRRRQR